MKEPGKKRKRKNQPKRGRRGGIAEALTDLLSIQRSLARKAEHIAERLDNYSREHVDLSK